MRRVSAANPASPPISPPASPPASGSPTPSLSPSTSAVSLPLLSQPSASASSSHLPPATEQEYMLPHVASAVHSVPGVFSGIWSGLASAASAVTDKMREASVTAAKYAAAPLMKKLFGDEEYLSEITSDPDAVLWIKSLCSKLPIKEDDIPIAESVVMHLFANIAKGIVEDKKGIKISSGDLIVEVIIKIENLCQDEFKKIKHKQNNLSRPLNDNDFAEAAKNILETLEPKTAYVSAYLDVFSFITPLLKDVYGAIENSAYNPSFNGHGKEVNELATHIANEALSYGENFLTEERLKGLLDSSVEGAGSDATKTQVVRYLLTKKSTLLPLLVEPITGIVCRQIDGIQKKVGGSSLTEFITNLFKELLGEGEYPATDQTLEQRLDELVARQINREPRVPAFAKEMLISLIKNMIKPEHLEKIRMGLELLRSRSVGQPDPLVRFGFKDQAEEAISKLLDQHIEKLVGSESSPKNGLIQGLIPDQFAAYVPYLRGPVGKFLIKQILMHLMRNFAFYQLEKNPAYSPASFNELLCDMVTFVIDVAVTGVTDLRELAPEDVLGRKAIFKSKITLLLEAFFPGGTKEPLRLDDKGAELLEPIWQIVYNNLKGSKIEGYKQLWRNFLWNPAEVQESYPSANLHGEVNELAANLVGIEPYLNDITAFTEGLAGFLVEKVKAFKSDGDQTAALRAVLAHPLVTELEANLKPLLFQTLLKGVYNIAKNQKDENPALPNDEILSAAISKAVKLIHTLAPATNELAQVPDNWKPLTHAVIEWVLPDLGNVLSITPAQANLLKDYIGDTLLPSHCVDWRNAFYLFRNNEDTYKASLKKTLGTNHAEVFSHVVGNEWVKNFIPHLMGEKSEEISEKTISNIEKKYHIKLSPSASLFVASTLRNLAGQYATAEPGDPKNSITILSEWVGRYAEAGMLRFFSETFSDLIDIDNAMKENKKGSLILEMMKRYLPEIDRFYAAVNELKEEKKGNIVRQLYNTLRSQRDLPFATHQELVQKLDHKGLLNPAFPKSEHLSEKQKEELMLVHFAELAERIVKFAHMDSGLAVPDVLEEEAQEALQKNVIAEIILASEKSVRKNTGEMLLNLFRTLKTAAALIPGDIEAGGPTEPKAPLKPIPDHLKLTPELAKNLGRLARNILARLPNQWFAQILEIKKIRESTEEQIGEVLVQVLHQKSLVEVINTGFEKLLPEMVPGKIVPLDDKPGIEFVQSDQKIRFSPPDSLKEDRLISLIKKEGAEAFMRGIEKLVVEKTKQKWSNASLATSLWLKKAQNEKWHKVVDVVGAGVNFIVKSILVPLLIGLLYIPYRISRYGLKFALARLAKAYYNELKRDYHQGMVLNLIDKTLDELKKEKLASPDEPST